MATLPGRQKEPHHNCHSTPAGACAVVPGGAAKRACCGVARRMIVPPHHHTHTHTNSTGHTHTHPPHPPAGAPPGGSPRPRGRAAAQGGVRAGRPRQRQGHAVRAAGAGVWARALQVGASLHPSPAGASGCCSGAPCTGNGTRPPSSPSLGALLAALICLLFCPAWPFLCRLMLPSPGPPPFPAAPATCCGRT